MNRRMALLLVGGALAVLALAGCSPTATPNSSAAEPTAPISVAPAPAEREVGTANTKLGTVLVDGRGMTVYFFNKDVAGSGKSNCAGACATMWPPVTSSGTTPVVDGVTGKVGTITVAGSSHQVTIGGRPIYTFANDKAAGDVNGQGFGKLWYAVDATGKEIKAAP